MTAILGSAHVRRAATLLVLTAALVLGACLPSWAAYTEAVALPQMTVSTAVVAVPGNVSSSVRCTGNTATVTLNWTASTASGVSGYRPRIYLNAAYQDQPSVSSTTTTWQASIDVFYVNNYTVTFSVWTLTDYGWTAESARTVRIVC
jgi:hypothetical protein